MCADGYGCTAPRGPCWHAPSCPSPWLTCHGCLAHRNRDWSLCWLGSSSPAGRPAAMATSGPIASSGSAAQRRLESAAAQRRQPQRAAAQQRHSSLGGRPAAAQWGVPLIGRQAAAAPARLCANLLAAAAAAAAPALRRADSVMGGGGRQPGGKGIRQPLAHSLPGAAGAAQQCGRGAPPRHCSHQDCPLAGRQGAQRGGVVPGRAPQLTGWHAPGQGCCCWNSGPSSSSSGGAAFQGISTGQQSLC